ncbi:MAG: peptidase M23, partial [Ginsengibacter sp.]
QGDQIQKGQLIAHFGKENENGHWPPHLHFQVIENIGDYQGDYPGVCKESEREYYLQNSPDPDLILNLNRLAV